MARAKGRLIVGLVIVIVAIAVWASVVFIRAVLDVPRLRNGKSTHYEGREPNQMILEYLEWRHRRKGK